MDSIEKTIEVIKAQEERAARHERVLSAGHSTSGRSVLQNPDAPIQHGSNKPDLYPAHRPGEFGVGVAKPMKDEQRVRK